MKPNRLKGSMKIALGWDGSASLFDLDMMALLVDRENRVRSSEHIVFYNQLTAFDGALLLSSDNQTGAGSGDDEELYVQLSMLPDTVDKIVLAIALHESGGRTFHDVNAAFVRMINDETKEEIVRYELGEDFSDAAGVVIGDVRRAEKDWRIVLTGSGVSGDFRSICRAYGLASLPEGFFNKKKGMNKISPLHIEKLF
ncbi:TerD family protein [Domibacillus sp. PGB-M46]|uniref:TerD family protein n=1 Tax=Domibacillus sp. PGB-M46 TaxID=2910255 RepID=UPI001F57C274|nr:TerD family protein [Domibacillus sp. PGB-M46]MCI2253355.1 TerD family protein [Domibacillus sp. PGB-M46]